MFVPWYKNACDENRWSQPEDMLPGIHFIPQRLQLAIYFSPGR